MKFEEIKEDMVIASYMGKTNKIVQLYIVLELNDLSVKVECFSLMNGMGKVKKQIIGKNSWNLTGTHYESCRFLSKGEKTSVIRKIFL